jgi:hypothetical protein
VLRLDFPNVGCFLTADEERPRRILDYFWISVECLYQSWYPLYHVTLAFHLIRPIQLSIGVPAQNLITSSVMSIPASIAISKLRFPELEEPVTSGEIVGLRQVEKGGPSVNALHAFRYRKRSDPYKLWSADP